MKAVAISKLLCFLLFLLPSLKTASQTISGIINAYYKVIAVNAATSTLTLTTTAGLSPGTRVLIIQMKGATIDPANTAAFGNIQTLNNAGNYEFNAICSISGNDVLLISNLSRTYTPAGSVQLITVPRYNIATVTDTIKASPWNATTGTGGVAVLEADTLNLNHPIDVRGAGFTGGPLVNYPTPTYDCTILSPVNTFFMGLPASGNFSAGPKGEGIADFLANGQYARGKQANGGGGGNNHNAGGGGGGNYGAGGSGGARSNVPFPNCTGTFTGVAGLSLATQGYLVNNRLFMGGGGGAGHENNAVGTPGGNGGGIVIVTANVVNSSGTHILADGSRPYNPAYAIDPFSSGGDGAGGGGAGGTIVLNVNEVIGNIQATATGAKGSDAGRTGASGDCPGPGGGGGGGVVWMKGAGPIANVTATTAGGANGVVHLLSVTAVCQGTSSGATAGADGAAITGFVPVISAPYTCTPLSLRDPQSLSRNTNYTDALLQWISLYPNPAAQQLQLSVFAKRKITIQLQLFTSTGQQLNSYRHKISAGHSTLTIPVHQLPAGVHWLVAEAEGMRSVQQFVKATK